MPMAQRHPSRRVAMARVSRVGRVALTYALLCAGAAALLVPFIFQVSTSLKGEDQVFAFPIQWIPNPIVFANYPQVFSDIPFLRYLLNSTEITTFGIVGSLFGSTLAAYPFARMRFPGRNVMFLLMLATMMVPGWVTLIPQFLLFRTFGWMDTYYPFIVPAFAASPFFTFLIRQFFMTIPNDLDDAAKIDGASSFQIFSRILVPLSKPVLATVGIFAFLGYWNEFLGPVIYLSTPSKFTVTVGIVYYQGTYRTFFPLLMAASTLTMLPPVIIFFLAQRLFVRGVVLSGIKG
jgi:multiple sugar transport system permease protein